MTEQKRFRLLTEQTNGSEKSRHLSSVILTEDEARQGLEVERAMHQAAGWFTYRAGFERERAFEDTPYNTLICKRNKTTRIITIESFDAMDDS